MRVGSSKMAIFAYFTCCIFRTCTSKATIIILCYIVPQWLFSDIEIDDLEWLWMTILFKNLFRARQIMSWRFWLWDKTVRKFEELPIHCQRRNCSPGNLVSSQVRFIWISAGGCWRGGVKWVWGRRKWRFSFLSLAISSEPSHSWPQLLYYVALVALHWHRNGWP